MLDCPTLRHHLSCCPCGYLHVHALVRCLQVTCQCCCLQFEHNTNNMVQCQLACRLVVICSIAGPLTSANDHVILKGAQKHGSENGQHEHT